MAIRARRRQPRRPPWRRGHEPVLAERRLHDDERPALPHGREERLVELGRRLTTLADLNSHAMLRQKGKAPAADARVRIDDGRHDALDPGFDDADNAWSSAAHVAARLERRIERAAARPVSGH